MRYKTAKTENISQVDLDMLLKSTFFYLQIESLVEVKGHKIFIFHITLVTL